MKNKTLGIIILVIGIVLLFICIILRNIKKPEENLEQEPQNEVELSEYVETLEDGTIKNNSEKLQEEKQFENFIISNIKLTAKENEEDATLMINVKNTSQKEEGDKNIIFVMKDKEGKEIAQIGVYLTKIEAKGVRTLEIETIHDVINTYDFEIIDEKLEME